MTTTTLALHDIEPELLEELTRRAERRGTTVEREALRALREYLVKLAPMSPIQERQTEAPPEPRLPEDARFINANGLWVFTGTIDSDMIPDHRELREERLDSLVRTALGENCD